MAKSKVGLLCHNVSLTRYMQKFSKVGLVKKKNCRDLCFKSKGDRQESW